MASYGRTLREGFMAETAPAAVKLFGRPISASRNRNCLYIGVTMGEWFRVMWVMLNNELLNPELLLVHWSGVCPSAESGRSRPPQGGTRLEVFNRLTQIFDVFGVACPWCVALLMPLV